MDDLSEIVSRRSAPGVLFFDLKENLLFFNKEASEITASAPALRETIRELCGKVKNTAHNSPAKADVQHGAIHQSGNSIAYAIRAFLVGAAPDHKPNQIMVLVEKIVEKRAPNLEKAKRKFDLTKREFEVLHLMFSGLTNKEIGVRLFISEQTAKDHVRNIMRKIGVNSRGALFSTLQ